MYAKEILEIEEVKDMVADEDVILCMTGSGARTIAEKTGIPFTQEVVANSLALKTNYSKVGTAIELGGQDAKIIFFREDEHGEPPHSFHDQLYQVQLRFHR